ncbi:VCBS repeat-containing protein [Sorangium sp. So ce1036]|uniref:FG-GAP repeat domain-containing protein n=1 Tax=Sorangium sp. So ce1036 TaxID=3133328 RepID=UPI003F01B871
MERSAIVTRVAAAISVGSSLLLDGAVASADWRAARHDPQRTGATESTSNILKPAPYWRAYLGGVLASSRVLAGDVDQDGEIDLLFVSGGRVVRSDPRGTTRWSTPSMDLQMLHAVEDLDGDGRLEAVALSGAGAAVIDGASGAVLWRENASELGSLGAARLADFDGDGRPDLFLDECGCCSVRTDSPGVIYSFARGFGAVERLPSLPRRDHCSAGVDTVGDWNGDGIADLLLSSHDRMFFVSGTGQVFAESASIGAHLGGAVCEAVSLRDGSSPGQRALCFQNRVYGVQGARAVSLLAYRPGESPSLVLVWRRTLSPNEGGDARAPTRLSWDLDGDGALEVLASGKSGDAWATYVLDAASGAELAVIPDEIAQGAIAGDAGAERWILSSREERVSAFRFRRGASPPVERLFSLHGERVRTRIDWSRARETSLGAALVTPDLTGDGLGELVLEATSEPVALTAYEVLGGQASMAAVYPVEPGVGLAALDVPPATSPASPRLVVSRDDGFVSLLDASLAPTNLVQEGREILPGLRAGGYSTGPGAFIEFGRAPLAARLFPGDTADSVVVVDSRGDLVRLDARGASNVAPAKVAWRAMDAFGASIVPAEGGSPATLACFRRRRPLTDPARYSVATLDANGRQTSEIALEKPPAWDVLHGDVDGDGALELVAITADPTLSTEVLALDPGGGVRWRHGIRASAGTQAAAIADWDGDGADDVAVAIDAARVLSGRDGSPLGQSPEQLTYFMPILADVSGGPQLEMTLQGGRYPARTLPHDLGVALWRSADDDRPYPHGAIARCGRRSLLVEGSFMRPSRLTITELSGPTAGASRALVLAGDAAFADEQAAARSGAALGQLGDVAISRNLTGRVSDGSTAVVGSTNGFLYAIDVCSARLVWSYAFGDPVGSPILADTDGDGHDDIVVSVADGYLYNLRHETLPAPELVWDVDPRSPDADEDVDEIETTDTLHVRWSRVASASSYQVAVVGGRGEYVSSPAWQDVGDVSEASIRGLPLLDGAKYYVGVRAVSAAGLSPDRGSDGVLVRMPQGEGSGGAGGTGGDASAGGAGGEGAGGAAGAGGGGTGGEAAAAPVPDDTLLYGRGCACSEAPGRLGASWAAGLGSLAVALLALARAHASPGRPARRGAGRGAARRPGARAGRLRPTG